MEIRDSEYIWKSLSGAKFNNLSDFERNTLLTLNSKINKATRLNDYNPNLDKSITQIINFEEPDLLIISSDIIYAIEHFRIDASKSTKKGSNFKRKYNKNYADNINNQIRTKLETEEYAMASEQINTPLSYQNLYENLEINFNNHYSKIAKYKDNIDSKFKLGNKEIQFLFFVQYDCIFPSFIFNENRKSQRFVFPDNDVRFIEYCKNKKNLKGIFFDYNSNSTNFPNRNRFLQIDNNNLTNYQIDNETTYDFTTTKVNDYTNPVVTTMVATINKNDK